MTRATVQRRGRELGRRLTEEPFDAGVLADLTVFLEDTVPVLPAVAPDPAPLLAAGTNVGPGWSGRRRGPVPALRALPGGAAR